MWAAMPTSQRLQRACLVDPASSVTCVQVEAYCLALSWADRRLKVYGPGQRWLLLVAVHRSTDSRPSDLETFDRSARLGWGCAAGFRNRESLSDPVFLHSRTTVRAALGPIIERQIHGS